MFVLQTVRPTENNYTYILLDSLRTINQYLNLLTDTKRVLIFRLVFLTEYNMMARST